MFEGLTYQFVYNLERHRVFNARMRRWLFWLCLTLPLVMWLGLLKVSYLVSALVTLGSLVTLIIVLWAARRRYVRFVECSTLDQSRTSAEPLPSGGMETEPNHLPLNSSPVKSILPAMIKVNIGATGHFEVSGMRRYLVETAAQYTTFETGEHCVLTQIHSTRFLLLGRPKLEEIGWWYTFFQPSMIRSVTKGVLYFGLRPRTALRLEIIPLDSPKSEILYLSFDDEALRSLVLEDLRHNTDL